MRRQGLLYAALLVLGVWVYAAGLGGQNIPRNGDEMVYAHIARLTSASGHWLPLVSQLDHMRNTKPPLLFWQAMVATQWGQNWSLWALRLPSLLYTLGTAALCALLAWRATASAAKGALAAAIYLAFLSSFRFGRPYLTSAAETWWVSVPMWWLAWHCLQPAWRVRLRQQPWRVPGWGVATGLGLALGLGAAYKSFALVLPACAAFWLALLWMQWPMAHPGRVRAILAATAQVAWLGVVALAVFGLWFVLDPDPGAVWHEFVLGENANKLGQGGGYWHAALVGGSSIWVQALAYMVNAGVLAFLVPGLVLLGWVPASNIPVVLSKNEHTEIVSALPVKPASTALRRLLLAWLLVWLLVFCIPSIRSARYVIPAMPALALALALAWERIGRAWFVASLAAAALCLLVLGRLAWVMAELGIADGPIAGLAALVFGLGAVSIGWALVRPAATRHAALAASLLVFASFNATVAALDGPAGHFDAQAVRTVYGLRVAVPSDFNAAFERYEFALPGNHIVPYPALATLPAPSASLAPASSARDANLAALLAQADAVVWATPAQAPDPCASGGCQVLARRWVVQSRQPPGAITLAALWAPQRWLLQREWLLARGP